MFRRSLYSTVLIGLVLTAGCSTTFDADEARAVQSIDITLDAVSRGNNSFSPNPVTVINKTQVIWTNRDNVDHQIVSSGGYFAATEPIKPGQTFDFLFNATGNFRYFCSIEGHREEGVINVVP